jgi:hypothetical protein
MATNFINGNTLLQSGSFPPARVASTGSPLTPGTGGLLVVDGIQLVAGDRVLCKDEASAVNNGIYAANTGPWVRTNDATNNQQFFSGMAVTIGLGAVNAGLTYLCTCQDDPVVVGTSLITWAAQSVIATGTQQATSTTSFTIGTGSKMFAVPSGLAFQANQWVIIQETSNSANQMLGQITSYNGGSLAVNVVAIGGAGTHADWTIVLTNSAAAAGYQPPIGSGNVTGPGSSTAGHVATFADTSGKVLTDGGALIGSANTILSSMLGQSAVALGCTMLNGQIVPSVGSSALTFTILTLAGNTPSAADPVWFMFRSATPGSGTPTIAEVTSALSVTIPASSTMGFANATPGRLWLVAVNNGGIVSLAVINCLSYSATAASIFPLSCWGIANVTAFGGGANSSAVLYGANSLSSLPYSVLGYGSYETGSTLGTAGTWSATPTRIDVYRPGVPLPGQVVQELATSTASAGSTTSTSFVALTSGLTEAITPSSSANLVKISAYGSAGNSSNASSFLQIARGSTLINQPIGIGSSSGVGATSMVLFAIDQPASLSTVTYGFQGKVSSGTLLFPSTSGGPAGVTLVLQEIMA